MDWTTLGTVTPVLEWTRFSVATNAEVFRLTHLLTTSPRWTPRALIAQFYGSDALGVRLIYARQGVNEIIELAIPEDLLAEGATTRQIAVKILPPRWVGSYAYDWSIQLEALVSSVTSASLADVMAEIEETELDIRGDITQLRSDLGFEP